MIDVLRELKKEFGWEPEGYAEPFCGMLGVFRHVPEYLNGRGVIYRANDQNGSVIDMWKKAVDGWVPPETCTEELWDSLCAAREDNALKGYICHQFSFAGVWAHGYAPKYGKADRNKQAPKRVKKIAEILNEAVFTKGDYRNHSSLENYVIYCDPPYSNTTAIYRNKDMETLEFDSEEFYDWCREMAKNNLVFVSGYDAPKDFTEVWNREVYINYRSYGMKEDTRVERLYIV
jgi:DNA adenine methylase